MNEYINMNSTMAGYLQHAWGSKISDAEIPLVYIT
jgi:hypothetical protein